MSNKKATIYTGTGDNGTTSLIGGERVAKDDKRVQAYGTIDELNAHLGLLNVALDDEQTREFIEQIEHKMLNIGCSLAGGDNRYTLTEEDINTLQRAIDDLEASLPAMHEFIIPGGTEAAARANLCRTICRRAERGIYNTLVLPVFQLYINGNLRCVVSKSGFFCSKLTCSHYTEISLLSYIS